MEHTDTFPTSQDTHYVSTTEPNRLMLSGKTVAVYCENLTEHTDTSCGRMQNSGILKQAVHILTTLKTLSPARRQTTLQGPYINGGHLSVVRNKVYESP
jgi:hypothetical protein